MAKRGTICSAKKAAKIEKEKANIRCQRELGTSVVSHK
jgi:hypothetical protein